ncbi:hypothetical protein [Maritalea porphyrae]|uniref:hypothetical protein n=1 Tax=Maritalea porphyrae TaxID=880732 RepID=UPI0022AF0796|nr:hypothetical protein [Maritalea porphyrae]MCZ4272793.1 hypothetical protein [Maritalea porphyrae]
MMKQKWTYAGLIGLMLAAPSFAQEVAPVPPVRPENLNITTPSETNENQDLNAETQIETMTDQETIVVPKSGGPPQPVSIGARVTEDGPFIPNGLEWRIYSITPNDKGELDLVARSSDSAANFSLAAGQYIAHVAYGRAQASDTISVQEGPNQIEIILDAGGLELNAAVTGDIPIPRRWLSFTVYADNPTNGGKKIIAQSVSPGKLLYLNSGTYSVVSHFGEVNATAKADLRVEPGQLTSATLYHKAAQVTFKLVSEPGGEAIADTSWIIKTPDGQTVYQEKSAFPQTVLEQGEYILIGKLGSRVFNREFEIVPGLPREIELLADAN